MNYEDVVSRAKIPEKFSVVTGGGITSNPSTVMLPNTPISGMKVVMGYGSFDSPRAVKIVDPRGFSVTLPTEAILQMLLTADIRDGEIMDECVWSFVTPQQPRVLATSSIVHQIITNPCKLTPRNLKLGDVVRLIGWSKPMTYLGKFFVAKTNKWYYSDEDIKFHDNSHHLFIRQEDGRLQMSVSPKIFSLLENTTKYNHLTVPDINRMIVNESGIDCGQSMVLRVTKNKNATIITIPSTVPAPLDLPIIRTRRNSAPITLEFSDGVRKSTSSYHLPSFDKFVREFEMVNPGNTVTPVYSGYDVVNFYFERSAFQHPDGTVEPI